MQIYTEHFDPTINGHIDGDTIYLYPALFINSLNKNNFNIKIEHIVAIIGHELGHYIFKHQHDNATLQEEIEADKYSKLILNKLNMNENSMCEILKIILNNKNFSDDKLIRRINELNK